MTKFLCQKCFYSFEYLIDLKVHLIKVRVSTVITTYYPQHRQTAVAKMIHAPITYLDPMYMRSL